VVPTESWCTSTTAPWLLAVKADCFFFSVFSCFSQRLRFFPLSLYSLDESFMITFHRPPDVLDQDLSLHYFFSL